MHLKKNLAVSDSGFIFNPTSGNSFKVNPIGLKIIMFLKEHRTFEEIKNHILEYYEADENVLITDLRGFIISLRKNGFLKEEKKIKN